MESNSHSSQPQQHRYFQTRLSSSATKQNCGSHRAALTIYVAIFALFFLVNLSMYREYRESLLMLEQPRSRGLRLDEKEGRRSGYISNADKSNGLSGEQSPMGRSASFSNSTKEQNQCRFYKSHQYAFPSTIPKVSIDMQTRLAMGGYEEIAKGSGTVTAAGSILASLSQIQHSKGVYGTVGELGVHHGRFTSFLFATARSTEALVVADLFEEHQSENVDLSGLGDFGQFVKGLSVYGLSRRDLHAIHRGNTGELPLDWSAQSNFAPFRLISVDASHTATSTRRDLALAFCNLVEGGIVVLDDWYHPSWPGVVEGYFQFAHEGFALADRTSHPQSAPATVLPLGALDVFPFLICESKLYLTNSREFHEKYYKHLEKNPAFQAMISPYSIEKKRGKVKYEMNGVAYLRCPSRKEMSESNLQELWASFVY
jgi:Methyltransferase domain